MIDISMTTPPRLICGCGSIKKIGSLAKELGGTRVLVVTDPGVHRVGHSATVEQALKAFGLDVCIFADVLPDPPHATVLAAWQSGIDFGANLVVGLGGGSSLDTAKVVSLLLGSDQSLDEMIGVDVAQGNQRPLIAIPTTAGTGSEATHISILTSDTNVKQAVYSRKILPHVALLDAELTVGMPANVSAATALDACVHAIEAFTSGPKKNAVSDALAKQALTLLNENFEGVMRDGQDLNARQNMLLGSTLAGMSFVNSTLASVHALAYPLGTRFHVPHGHANALVMSEVFAFNAESVPDQFVELSRILHPDHIFSDSNQALTAFFERIGRLIEIGDLPKRLRDVGVTEEIVPEMAQEVVDTVSRLLANNPRAMTVSDIQRIYEQAY